MINASRIFDKFSIIEGLPLFSELTFIQKELVALKSQIVEFKKGQLIYEEDSPPDYFYCVVNGRIEIYHPGFKNKTSQELRIEIIRRGDYFGSISALTGQNHSVSARALNDSVVLRIDIESFDFILRRIPRLAVFLSRSLSRRLSEKALKEVFESTIIAVYSQDNDLISSDYAASLSDSLEKESGKKVLIVRINKKAAVAANALKTETRILTISNKNEISSALSLLTKDYHYVLIDMPARQSGINFEILRQADSCHIISASDKPYLNRASRLIKKLENAFKKYSGQKVHVILNQDASYEKTSYAAKVKILGREIFGTLPEDKAAFAKAVRRMAREISGARLGLALGSGAAMGLAHIGVLKTLEEEKIPVDVIAGTSMGAFVATLWAAGYTSKEIEQIASKFKSKLKSLSLADFTLPVRGLIKGKVIRNILKSYLGAKTFYNTKLPLKVVACDIKNRREVVIDKGSLVDAVMASIAIPGVFEPMECLENLSLVDGGIVNPVPVSVLSRMGIKKIIAVNVLPSPEDIIRKTTGKPNIYDAIVNSFQAMEYTMAEYSCQHADIYLHPIAKYADWFEFYKGELFIKTGRKHAKLVVPKIKELLRK